jgi:hypothetical protein
VNPPSLNCEHIIPADTIILYEENMVGYCEGCAARVQFPIDPFQTGARNMLTAVIGQIAAGEQPELEILTEIIDSVGRVEKTIEELRELLDLISRMYEEQLDGELGADIQREAVVTQHRAQMASYAESEACEALEGIRLGESEDWETPET